MTPSITLQKIAMTIPAITIAPPSVSPTPPPVRFVMRSPFARMLPVN